MKIMVELRLNNEDYGRTKIEWKFGMRLNEDYSEDEDFVVFNNLFLFFLNNFVVIGHQ